MLISWKSLETFTAGGILVFRVYTFVSIQMHILKQILIISYDFVNGICHYESIIYTKIPVSEVLGFFFNAFMNLYSLCQAFRQGMMKTLTSAIAMPPMEGIAIGLATLTPVPVDHIMGDKTDTIWLIIN